MKKMILLKKVLAAAVGTAILSAAMAIPSSAAKSFESAEKAVGNIKAGWNLGNALDSNGAWIKQYSSGAPSDYETAWGNPVTTRELISAVKKAGFNAVRVPVTWAEHIDGSGNIDKEWLDRVQEVVDYVISQDLYCVLDVHHDAGSEGWLKASESSYKSNSDKFAGLWKNIAERFRDYGEKLIFEGYNEILDSSGSWNDAKQKDAYQSANDFNQLFVDTVRKTGGNNAERNLMVQVYSGSVTEKSLAGFVLPKDTAKDHLIIQVHNYDPQGFTFSDAAWTTMTDKWGTDEDKAYMDEQMARLSEFSKLQGAPLAVGEFGADFKNNDSSRKAYAGHFVSEAAKYGIKCFWWDTGGMALFDRKSCTVTHPDVVKALTEYSVNTSSTKAADSKTKDDTSKDSKTGSSQKESKLPAPTVKAKAGTDKITIKWSEVDGAHHYKVYQYDPKTKKYTKIKAAYGTSCTIKDVKKGSYKFIVCAVQKTDGGYVNGKYPKAVTVSVK